MIGYSLLFSPEIKKRNTLQGYCRKPKVCTLGFLI